jgi:cytoskeletal protein CcmA (bactofilin family)
MPKDWLQFVYSPSMISEGTRLKGDLTFVSNAQVHGVVEGSIAQSSLENVQVGPTGWVYGSIDSKGPVVIEGRVDGNITSDTSIRLMPTATVSGALKAPIVRVLPGALLQGEIQMHASKVRAVNPRRSVG